MREGMAMNGEGTNGEETDDVVEDIEFDDDVIDNVGDISVEINVEELVAKIEDADGDESASKKEIHRRMEALNEQREADKEMDSTFNFNLDDNL